MSATAVATEACVIARADLAAALRVLGAIKAQQAVLDPTAETLRVSGYADEVGVTFDTKVVPEGGAKVSVPRVALAALLPFCESEVRLSLDAKVLTVESGCAHFELQTTSPAGRVSHPDPSSIVGREATYEAPTLVEVLRRSLPSVGKDQTRPMLCRVALYSDNALAVSTDSYRLAIVRYDDARPDASITEQPLLLDRDACAAIRRHLSKRLGQVAFREGETHIAVAFENVAWSIRREKGSFPDWRKLLPDAEAATVVKVDRDDLLTAARAAGAIVGDRFAPLRLNIDGGGARVSSEWSARGKMNRTLPSAEVVGADIEVCLNPAFLADICASSPVERPTLRIVGALRPLLVEAGRDKHLLMPVRLNA